MAGSAILDPDVLVDDLVTDVIDGLREELHTAFGVRAYRLFTVVRTWSGGAVGRGSSSDVEVQIEPQPKVHPFKSHREQQECGYDVVGAIKVTEVSLSYTQAELLACEAAAGSQHFIKVVEAHGQLQGVKYFVYKGIDIDREQDFGWILHLILDEDAC